MALSTYIPSNECSVPSLVIENMLSVFTWVGRSNFFKGRKWWPSKDAIYLKRRKKKRTPLLRDYKRDCYVLCNFSGGRHIEFY